ncbi:MAG: transglycosylase SLT domain-containing protein [Armatimonadota bacterium]
MQAFLQGSRGWMCAAGAAGLAVAGFGAGRLLGSGPSPSGQLAEATTRTETKSPSSDPALTAVPEADAESVVLAQKKRIMGRLNSLEMVSRVATTIRPLLDKAHEMPEVQADMKALAKQSGMSLAEYRDYFKGKQEADLLLESGGDPNARSVADAIGVAQFLASTGRSCGLKVDLGASNRLSREIAGVEREIDWLQAQAESWTRPVPVALRPYADRLAKKQSQLQLASAGTDASEMPGVAPAPKTDVWTRDQWLDYRRSQRERLIQQRRQADERFDPFKAIRAQTKYLVRLTRRYGGVDWALQAYHGGEGGASRTISLFAEGLGSRTQLASRGYTLGGDGRWLPYAELYRRVSPTGTPGAFGYLFGRSDDHRYYWWKVLMAERALNLYREDPEAFKKEWQALQPGLSSDAVWYADPSPLSFSSDRELAEGYRSGTLVPLPASAVKLGVRTQNLAALQPSSEKLHKGLRPEAMGALLRLAAIYRQHGGREPLVLLSMVETESYREKFRARYPLAPLPPDVPRDPEFHTMGVTFDVKRPSRDWDRKVLEYSLGRLYDSLRITWRPETEAGSRRYHVAVNPEHKAELAAHYEKAK